MSAKDYERIAYLAGEPVESLSAEERAELDELRDLLRSPSTWTEPAPDLEDRVVSAISAQAGAPSRGARLRRMLRLPRRSG